MMAFPPVTILKEPNAIPGCKTWNTVARLLKYITVDGYEVGVNPRGGLQLTLADPMPPAPSASAATEYDGPFAVTADGATRIRVNGGYVNCNGAVSYLPPATMARKNGLLCVHASLTAVVSGVNGSVSYQWETPCFKYASAVTNAHYPIARITDKAIHCCRVGMAFFIQTAVCPYVRPSNQ